MSSKMFTEKGVLILEDSDRVLPASMTMQRRNRKHQSRRQREGAYSWPDPTGKKRFMFRNLRKRGHKSRQLAAQFFDNGHVYDLRNDPAIKRGMKQLLIANAAPLSRELGVKDTSVPLKVLTLDTDFDGDEAIGTLQLDPYLAEQFEQLKPKS